jgi:hypothetical protein
MADLGIYSLWPVVEGLGLGVPVSAEAMATHACTVNGRVSRAIRNDYSYPAACTLRFQFAPVGDRPAMELFWYDGGMRPRLPKEIERHDLRFAAEGILYVGDSGMILAEFGGLEPQLFASGARKPLRLEEDPPSERGQRGNRLKAWVGAVKGGEASPGSFLNAATITDTVNLGTVALRAGTRVSFDSASMRITNVDGANRYLVREYREGWEL